ncbi:MAG: PD40 domain-containing protein [Oligoflexia bacterium]|nr:PD40 domain-containing protein [Oligoflexia bacterium]
MRKWSEGYYLITLDGQLEEPKDKGSKTSVSKTNIKDAAKDAKGKAREKEITTVRVSITAYDIRKNSMLYQNQILLNTDNLREEGHRVSHEIFRQITGKESIFTSKIYFVSDRESDWVKKNIIKELYFMDFDGFNIVKVTNHRGIVISPSISTGQQLAVYSLIRDNKGRKRNNDLYLLNMKTKVSEMISSREGINSGAIFTADNDKIILTLTDGDNTDIFWMDIKTKETKKITDHPSVDVDPDISPDGNTLAFVSGRPGKAMIYLADPRGVEKDVRRLSYVGDLHATPRFSPLGQELVLVSWIDNAFDIYRIDTQGNNIVRLTKDFGSNEAPSFSPDGEFIVFSSQRTISRHFSVKNLYIMDREGEILGAITSNLGNCTTPRWVR